MRTRLIVLAAFLLLLGLGGVAGVYFYDDSKSDQIAEGVKVNGVPIGGMTPAQAEKKLSATLLAPLDRPVKVRYKDRTFTLSQKAAAIGIDIRGSVDKALKRSQEGDMFTRTWRNVRNESLDTELAAEVSYNQPAIRKLVKRVQKSIDRKPVDAKVDLSKGHRRADGLHRPACASSTTRWPRPSSRRCSTRATPRRSRCRRPSCSRRSRRRTWPRSIRRS